MAISIILSYPVIVFPCRFSIDALIFPDRPLSSRRFILQNVSVVVAAFLVAVAIPSFATVLGIFGAVTSTIIGYVLPSIFYLKLSDFPFRHDRKKWLAAGLLFLGTLGGLVSFILILVNYV